MNQEWLKSMQGCVVGWGGGASVLLQILQCWQHVTRLLPHLAVPTQVLQGLTAAEQQMKSTHVIYRQRFLLKNNCGDRGWAQGSMAMDFSVVGSCSVGRNERWKEREGGEEAGRRDRRCFSDRKGLTRSSVTILEFRDTGVKKSFCCFVLRQKLWNLVLSTHGVLHEHRIIWQSLNGLG